MKKKLTVVATIFIACTITISVISHNKKNNSYQEKNFSNTSKQIVGENTLSMMLEKTVGSGDYEMVTQSSWPTSGYIFNASLSKCENGSELSWDDENNLVSMSGNVSDKCYVYFDKVILPTVTASVTSVTENSITITSTATKGTFDVSKYYYSKDGATFTESSSNTYTFSSLNDSTTYNIVVYVVDTKGNKSSNYIVTSTTKSPKPVITSATITGANTDFYYPEIYFTINYTSKNTISEVYVSDNGSSFRQCYSDERYHFRASSHYCSGDIINNIKFYIVNSEGTASDVYTISSYTVSCFPAGTKIFTKNGYKNIEDIEVNDIVYSYNETTKKVELNKVTKTFIHQDIEIYNLYLDNEIIRVTPYHRFYVLRNNNYEWVAVKDLKLTDKLFDSNKEVININKIEYMKENNTVYNFEVANNHTYFVSENNILVHNAKGC